MSKTDNYEILRYAGNGSADEFPITWPFLADGDVSAAIVTDATGAVDSLALTTDYTLAGAGEDSGGALTLAAGNLASGLTLVIWRATDPTQPQVWRNGGVAAINGKDIERGDDRLTLLAQEVLEKLARCVQYAETVATSDMSLDPEEFPAAVLAARDAAEAAQAGAETAQAAAEVAQAGAESAQAGAEAAASMFPVLEAADAYKLLFAASGGGSIGKGFLPALAGRAASHNAAGSSTTTLSAAEYGCQVIDLTGLLTGNHDVVFPAAAGVWLVRNATTGDYTLTLKPSGGSGIAMKLGERSHIVIVSDGSTIRELSRMQQFVGSVDVDLTTTGSQAVTGVGFRPVCGVFFAARANTVGEMSVGAANLSAARIVAARDNVSADTWTTGAGSTGLLYYLLEASAYAYATLTSFDADGFTFNKNKSGSPAGTGTLNFILIGS